MMTFEQQDAALRDRAKFYKLNLRKRPGFQKWRIYRDERQFAYAIRSGRMVSVAYGTYGELLKFFEGIEYGRRNS